MDAKTCLKKLEYVGVLAFATVDAQGNPQRERFLQGASGRRKGADPGLYTV